VAQLALLLASQLKSDSFVNSGGLATKHPALGAKGHRFDPSKRSKLFQRLISRLTTSRVADHVEWAAVSTELLKIKGD